RFTAPSSATLRRVLIELDADELDTAVGAWLREHAACDQEGWVIALDGKDLHGSWNDEGRLVLFSAMTHRGEHQDAVVLGQIRVPEGTTETTQVRALLEPIDITGALVTADAAHTCAETARYLVEDKKADYLLTIKVIAARRGHRHRPRADRRRSCSPAHRTRPWTDQPLDHLEHRHRPGTEPAGPAGCVPARRHPPRRRRPGRTAAQQGDRLGPHQPRPP